MEVREQGLNSSVYTIVGFILALSLSYAIVELPIITLAFVYYLAIGLLLPLKSRIGIILLVLSFPMLHKSLATVTGTYYSFFYYLSFFLPLLLLIYGNVLGFRIRLPHFLMDKLLVLFAVYLIFSVVVISSEKAYGMEKVRYFINNVILFYLPILLIKNLKDFEQVVKGIVVFGFFFTAYALLSYTGVEGFYGNSYANRFATLGINPIWVARYFSYIVLAELYWIAKMLRNNSVDTGKILLLSFLILVQLFLAFLTASRGPILGLLLGIIVAALVAIRFKISHLIFIAGVILIVAFILLHFIPTDLEERLLSQDQRSVTTTYIRLAANLEALDMFMSNKVFGAGLGAFNVFYLKYPHNVFTEVLSELGLIGFSLFIWILGLAVYYLFRMSKKFDKIGFHFLIAIFVTALVNSNISGHLGTNYYLFFSLGLIYAAQTVANGTKNEAND